MQQPGVARHAYDGDEVRYLCPSVPGMILPDTPEATWRLAASYLAEFKTPTQFVATFDADFTFIGSFFLEPDHTARTVAECICFLPDPSACRYVTYTRCPTSGPARLTKHDRRLARAIAAELATYRLGLLDYWVHTLGGYASAREEGVLTRPSVRSLRRGARR